MMEGFHNFRKASASTSAAVLVFDRGAHPRLETGYGVKSSVAPVLGNTNRIKHICIVLNLTTLQAHELTKPTFTLE